MKSRNRKTLIDLLYCSQILEQKEEKKKGPIDFQKYVDSSIDGSTYSTSNRLALGRPKALGKELREKSTNPDGAAEIMKTLGVSGVGGINIYEQVKNLIEQAKKHQDFGKIVARTEFVLNSKKSPTKIGVLIAIAGGLPPKETFYYVRELWRAAKTNGQLSGKAMPGSARLEYVGESEHLIFYHGKSQSWNSDVGEM